MRTNDKPFHPPFCPNPRCEFHLYPPRDPSMAFLRMGTPSTERFRCLGCRKKFRAAIFEHGVGWLH